MSILTVNTGSSSIRLAVFSEGLEGVTRIAGRYFKIDEGPPEKLLRTFLNNEVQRINVVAHRVVHGGIQLVDSCLINEKVEKEIERLSPLAPLHNSLALKWIQMCRYVLGIYIPQVAVFDTAFYSSLPDEAKTYALPKKICDRHEIRRYGFHGLAHRAMSERWQKIRSDVKDGGNVISLQLGSGCSITAIRKGKPLDTSMGFSPLEGLVMATRPGDVDPGALIYLLNSAGITVEELDSLLNNSSGLLGVSGISGDMQTLLESNDINAHLAVELYCYRAKKYIGAYMAALSGVDSILFGGGVGENASVVRKKVLEDMDWCGIKLDDRVNNGTIGKEGRISLSSSKVDVWVIPVDEATLLAKEAVAVTGLK